MNGLVNNARLRRFTGLSACCFAVALFGLAAAPASAQMFRGGPAHSGSYEAAGAPNFGGYQWRFTAGGSIRSSPTIVGDRIYFGSSDGRLYCLDAEGRLIWSHDLAAGVASSPAVAGGLIVIQSNAGRIVALRESDGGEAWSVQTGPEAALSWGLESGDYYVSSAAVADGVVFIGAADGYLRALDLETGRERWRLKTDGRIRSTPAVADGRVVVGSFDGSVYAADARTGRPLWRFDTQGHSLNSADFGFDRRSIQSSAAISDGMVFIGARDGFLYALDAATGRRKWLSDHHQSWVITSPSVSGGVVYAGSSDEAFVQALDAATGRELWRQRTPGIVWASPVLAGDVLYVATVRGSVRALNVTDGSRRYGIVAEGDIRATPAVMGDRLIVATEAGHVYAVRAAARNLRRVVYYDEAVSKAGWYEGQAELATRLNDVGFETLDTAGLVAFMTAALESGDAGGSVVVFATDHLADGLLAGSGHESLFRRYLDAGGDVVWVGLPPNIWPKDPVTGRRVGGYSTIDRARASALLDVDFGHASFDLWDTVATEAGRSWGLRDWWAGSWSVDPASVDEVLARDERGMAVDWIKRYPGGGSFRMIGRGGGAVAPGLVQFVAEHQPQ